MKRNSKVTSTVSSAIALVLATASTTVLAAGFQIGEHSATGLGRANAGEGAIADTALVLTKNPAAMTMFDKTTVSSQLAFIAPDVNTDYEYDDVNKCTGFGPGKTCEKISATESDYAPDQFVPSFAAIMPVNEKVAVGFAMFSNYGTGTEVSDEFAYGDLGGTTSIITIDSSFNIAYKVNDLFSVGVGYDLVIGQAKMKKSFNTGFDNSFDMSGNAIGHGWNIGTLFTINDNNRLALTYRSAVDMSFEGDFDAEGVFNPGVSLGEGSVTGTVDIILPAIAEISGYHKLTDIFAVHYSAMWTQWSSLTELTATSESCESGGNPLFDPFENGVCFQKDLHYSDSMRYAVGATAYVSESVTLRMGYAYDEQAGEAVVVMPDTIRHQISAGMSYAVSNTMSLDLGAAYIFGDEVSFTEYSELGGEQEFTSTGTAIIVSAQMNMVF
ncbi:MAG: outer membrane protein transport protein [Moritella sp.]|uniref:OmpP1/FadL family transporter n=1 Tax=Moritella sp. TaxID=78556 RepID=UPI000C0DE34D|nr:outer membrane protein transport protein [Moritella sp.]MBL1416096.1 outer membrane protein transport protein [Moritella sp.]